MNDDFARGKCPVCGCETVYRQNKNRILYTFCRNGHHAKLGREDSISANAKIAGGNNWNNGILYLYPLNRKEKENDGRTIEKQTTGTAAGTSTTSARAEFIPTTSAKQQPVSGTAGGTVQATGTTNDRKDDSGDLAGWL